MTSTNSFALPLILALAGAVSACSGNDSNTGTQPVSGAGGDQSGSAGGGGDTSGSGGALGGNGGSTLGNGGVPNGSGGGGSGDGGSLGSGGVGGSSGGENSSGGSGTGGAPPAKPPCLQDSNQIVLIGDSYINWVSHTFPTDINTESGLTIEDFAIGGTSMGSGGIGLIPPQFDTALAKHPDIRAIIMDGGGNDVLVPDTVQFPQGGQCKMMGATSPTIPDCQKIVQKALDAGRALFLHMAQAGVKDALFFFYPHVPTGTIVGGTDPNGMLDYALPKIKEECDTAYDQSVAADPNHTIRCHFVDLVPVFEGHPDYFAPTDIHPNPTGSKAMAKAIWAKMKTDCIAQPASSGCCEP
ncbi:MAG TPA: SGNH/GDSL hydrolase family protein [Polyangiaceae bacterium]|nr:SGNH/GDSL hydrolase family protein [Polyangiaceae bacterium]